MIRNKISPNYIKKKAGKSVGLESPRLLVPPIRRAASLLHSYPDRDKNHIPVMVTKYLVADSMVEPICNCIAIKVIFCNACKAVVLSCVFT